MSYRKIDSFTPVPKNGFFYIPFFDRIGEFVEITHVMFFCKASRKKFRRNK